MSDIVQKSFAAIPRLISSSLFKGGSQSNVEEPSAVSRELQTLTRAVDGAKGRSAEAALIRYELQHLREQLEDPGASVDQWCLHLPTAIFCSMMGYDASFARIIALKLAAKARGQKKRAGYLAAMWLLTPHCDITILSISMLQRDLQSSNILDNILALSAATVFVSSEQIPSVLPPVVKLLQHQQPAVRARAACCIDTFFRRTPHLVLPVLAQVKRMLSDKDPCVLSAVVTLIAEMQEEQLVEFVSVGPVLINMLSQVRANRFGDMYKYKGVPLPWFQMKLLRVLTRLSAFDLDLALKVILVVRDILGKMGSKETVALCLLEECLRTTAILANLSGEASQSRESLSAPSLMFEARVRSSSLTRAASHSLSSYAESVLPTGQAQQTVEDFVGCIKTGVVVNKELRTLPTAFLTALELLLKEVSVLIKNLFGARNTNLHFLAVNLLSQVTASRPEMAASYQTEVVQCLNHADPIVRCATLTVLHNMANKDNAEAVCSAMLAEITSNKVGSLKGEVPEMVCNIAGRFAVSPLRYLFITSPLLLLTHNSKQLSAVSDIMLQFLFRASHKFKDQSDELVSYLVKMFLKSLHQPIAAEDASPPVTMFALSALRFLPLSMSQQAEKQHRTDFLSACSCLLNRDTVSFALKEKVVSCIQQLMLKRWLTREEVQQWVKAEVSKMLPTSTPRTFRQRLSELSALASLATDLHSLSAPVKPSAADLSLSFMDPFVFASCKEEQFLLKPVLPSSSEHYLEQGYDIIPQKSGLCPSSNDGVCGIYVSASPSPEYTTSGKQSSKDSQISNALPISFSTAKQVWSKEGFVGDKTEESGFSLSKKGESSSGTSKKTSKRSQRFSNTEIAKQNLAEALFKGITPIHFSESLVSSQPPLSDTAHVLLSSFSREGQRADADNTINPAYSILYTSLPDTELPDCLTSALSSLSLPSTEDVEKSCSAADKMHPQSLNFVDQSWSSILSPDTGGWKALHASHLSNPEALSEENVHATLETETLEPDVRDHALSPAPDNTLTDPESGNSLCLSTDSLEDGMVSGQSSPAKRAEPSTNYAVFGDSKSRLPLMEEENFQKLKLDDGNDTFSLTEEEISQQLEAQIAEYERTTAARVDSYAHASDRDSDGATLAASLLSGTDQPVSKNMSAEGNLYSEQQEHEFSGFVDSHFEAQMFVNS